MPTYTFKDKTSGDITQKVMKISELDDFKNKNPDLEVVVSATPLGDPVRLGVRKPDGGFKEVLQKIHSKTPGSRLNTTADI